MLSEYPLPALVNCLETGIRRLNTLDRLRIAEGLLGRKYLRPYACAKGRTHAAIVVVQFYWYAGGIHKVLGKQATEEQVAFAGPYYGGVHAVLAHDIKSVSERTGNTLLRRAEDVSRRVQVEVDTVQVRPYLFVTQHALGTITEWHNAQAAAAQRGVLGFLVYCLVA
jgi:hypothetical protein